MPKYPFPYEIIYSNRKTLAIQITVESKVRVRAPKNTPRSMIEGFLSEKEGWILKHLQQKKKAAENNCFSNQMLSETERRRYRKMHEIFLHKKPLTTHRSWALLTVVLPFESRRHAGGAALLTATSISTGV